MRSQNTQSNNILLRMFALSDGHSVFECLAVFQSVTNECVFNVWRLRLVAWQLPLNRSVANQNAAKHSKNVISS